MQVPTVRNMYSTRSDNPVANQFIIEDDNRTIFQSYSTIVALVDKEDGQVYLDKNNWNYSVTTSKYRNQFLQTDTANTKKMIKSGFYKLADLNGGK